MDQSLDTINITLTILAVVSVLGAIVLIGIAIGAFVAYRRVTTLLADLEHRQIAPVANRVNAILDDVKGVSATVRAEAERVDHAIHRTMGRVDDTVDRVRGNVHAKTSRIIGLVRGVRVALETILTSRVA